MGKRKREEEEGEDEEEKEEKGEEKKGEIEEKKGEKEKEKKNKKKKKKKKRKIIFECENCCDLISDEEEETKCSCGNTICRDCQTPGNFYDLLLKLFICISHIFKMNNFKNSTTTPFSFPLLFFFFFFFFFLSPLSLFPLSLQEKNVSL